MKRVNCIKEDIELYELSNKAMELLSPCYSKGCFEFQLNYQIFCATMMSNINLQHTKKI